MWQFNSSSKTIVVLLPIADVGSEKPSTSTPQKRPSSNTNEYVLSKRVNWHRRSKNGSATPTEEGNDGKKADFHNTISEGGQNTDEHFASSSQNDATKHSVSSNNSNVTAKQRAKLESMSVSTRLTTKDFMDQFHSEWFAADKSKSSEQEQCKYMSSDSIRLYNWPFKLCIMSQFLQDSSLTEQMVDEMSQMEWHRKQMDLYEFHQTTDLANVQASTKPALSSFYNMLTNEMLPWMKEITGLPLTRISASCSMYNYGDYLLVHDDLLSDRQIAFVFYLSPWCDEWTENMGGALELFEGDAATGQPKYPIVQKFPPRNNQFVFFRVCKQSFHQVGEVTNLVYPRLTINGWFHGLASPQHGNSTASEAEQSVCSTDTSIEYEPPSADEFDLNEWISACYLRKRVKGRIQQHIEDKSEASLEMFLISDFFDLLVNEFKDNGDNNWVLEGPANQRKYETLRFTPQTTGPLKDLYSLFTSESMFSLLHEYTELDFCGSNAQNPTCTVQLCRFTRGSYTLLGDSTTFGDSGLDVILFFDVRDGVGKITYLCPSQGVDEYNTTIDTYATTSSMDVSAGCHSMAAKKKGGLTKTSTRNRSKANHSLKTEDGTSESESKDEEGENGHSACTTMEDEDTTHDSDSPEDSEADSDDDYDELAQEDALLTIHPKNNSLNLIYRLSGQTKFVKYISKNSLRPNEYVYILFASYKE